MVAFGFFINFLLFLLLPRKDPGKMREVAKMNIVLAPQSYCAISRVPATGEMTSPSCFRVVATVVVMTRWKIVDALFFFSLLILPRRRSAPFICKTFILFCLGHENDDLWRRERRGFVFCCCCCFSLLDVFVFAKTRLSLSFLLPTTPLLTVSNGHGNGEWRRMAENRGKQCISDSHGNGEWRRMAENRRKTTHK